MIFAAKVAHLCSFISRKEITELRGELDDERQKRVSLQVVWLATETQAELSTFIRPISLDKYWCFLCTREQHPAPYTSDFLLTQ